MAVDSKDDWQIIPGDWWRISYAKVDWQVPLFLHTMDTVDDVRDYELNPDLVGVRLVEQVLGLYESLVGFDVGEPKVPTVVQDKQIASHNERWNQLMSELMEGVSSPASTALGSSISALDSLDLARGTPKPKSSAREIRSCSPSPNRKIPSSFTFPSISQSPPSALYSSLSDFTFPSLSAPPVPKLKIQKDDQGFYSVEEVKPPTLLPPFLHGSTQRRKPAASKTRSIVDRLRKADVSPMRETVSHSPSPSPPFSADSPFFHSRLSVSEDGGDREAAISIHSLEEESDGWIGLSKTKQEVLSTSKARRTRDLFRALRRHRSDSSSPSDSGKDSHTEDSQLPPLSPSSSSPSPSSSTQSSNDGWIEGIITPPPKVRPRRRPQSQSRGNKTQPTHHPTQSLPPTFPTISPALHPPRAPPPLPLYPAFNTFQLVHPQLRTYAPTPQPYFYAPYSIVPAPFVAAYPVAYHHPHPSMHHIRQTSRPSVR